MNNSARFQYSFQSSILEMSRIDVAIFLPRFFSSHTELFAARGESQSFRFFSRESLTKDCMPRQSNQRADGGCKLAHQQGAHGLVRVSAGELLGRTHEELVLLLIQLRRQNATIYKAMETCQMEIEAQVRIFQKDHLNEDDVYDGGCTFLSSSTRICDFFTSFSFVAQSLSTSVVRADGAFFRAFAPS